MNITKEHLTNLLNEVGKNALELFPKHSTIEFKSSLDKYITAKIQYELEILLNETSMFS